MSTYGGDAFRLNPLTVQFFRFAGVGVIGTLAHYFVLVVLVHLASMDPVAASTAGFLVGAITNYLLNYHYTFASSKNHSEAFSKFLSIALVGMLFNGVIMSFCIEQLNAPYIIAQFVATGLVLVWNFSANRLWTFNTCRRDNQGEQGE